MSVCLSVTAYRVPDHQVDNPEFVGPCYGDFKRQPHLKFILPIVENQIAECFVDATVNPGCRELRLMIDGPNWPLFLLADICIRALLHPAMKEFCAKHDCRAPLPLRYGSGLTQEEHLKWIDETKKILTDAEYAIQQGIVLSRLDTILLMSKGSMGVMLTALTFYCAAYEGEAREHLRETANRLAGQLAMN